MVISAKMYFQFGDSVPQPKKWHQCNDISFMVDSGSLLLKAKGIQCLAALVGPSSESCLPILTLSSDMYLLHHFKLRLLWSM